MPIAPSTFISVSCKIEHFPVRLHTVVHVKSAINVSPLPHHRVSSVPATSPYTRASSQSHVSPQPFLSLDFHDLTLRKARAASGIGPAESGHRASAGISQNRSPCHVLPGAHGSDDHISQDACDFSMWGLCHLLSLMHDLWGGNCINIIVSQTFPSFVSRGDAAQGSA